ncbi:MAG: SGNH/GDSL hydrolase family protein [Lacrimispora saccharolytica]
MKKKSILCYGDSNTFGHRPTDGQRYPYGVRWTSLLAENLGKDFQVIEAGLNSRTTVIDDEVEKYRNGLKYIDVVVEMNWPLDLVILMLGTNDMKVRYQAQAVDIAEGARSIVREIRRLHQEIRPDWMPQILLVSPLLVGEKIRDGLSDCSEGFGGERAYWLSRELAPLYQQVAREEGCHFLDAGSVASAGTADALHLEEEGHRDLAAAMEAKVREIFQEA